MLVSVTERVREIGLRKALGARPALIRRQFLVEASVLGFAGGVLGVLAGAGVVRRARAGEHVRVEFELLEDVSDVVVAIGVGVLFGVYPADRAAKLDPINALRAE